MLHGYQRPEIEWADYFDEHGTLIPYGQRWDGLPQAESYSVTSHPQRFAPVKLVAQALLDWMQGNFEVRCFEDPELARQLHVDPGEVVSSVRIIPADSRCAPAGIVITTFPGVLLELGALYQAVFPNCGCDGCDDDVPEILDELENQVGSAVCGAFVEILQNGTGRLVQRFDSAETGFAEQASALDDISPARLARAHAILPPSGVWAPWPLR
jgi:hypothetical protein